jgi:TonB family protein
MRYNQDLRKTANRPTSDSLGRALTFSIIIHLCAFASSTAYGYFNHSFAKPLLDDYSIQLGDFSGGDGSGIARMGSTSVDKVQTSPQRKRSEKKTAAKKTKASPLDKKSVTLPKLAKSSAPADKTRKLEAKSLKAQKAGTGLEASDQQKTKVAIGAKPAPKAPVSKVNAQPAPSDEFDDDFLATASNGRSANESEATGLANGGGFISPELRWHVEMLRSKVRQNWTEPRYLLPPGSYAHVVIRCEIGRDGVLASDPMVFESSNISGFDRSGYRAVVRAAPFPPLPESLRRNIMGIRFKFEFGEPS